MPPAWHEEKRMMKKSVMTCASVVLVCLWLTSGARAAIVSESDDWGVTLDANESITCIAHFVWGSVEFTDVPEQRWKVYPDYDNGGEWEDIGWQAELSPDNKIAYMYGPQITNDTVNDNVGWFAYALSYQWDDAVADPLCPVYIDTALYDGPYGSEPTNCWGWRGIPGDPDSWEYREVPYYTDDPEYEEGFYNNPAPEPMTICLLGLGTVFLRKRR